MSPAICLMFFGAHIHILLIIKVMILWSEMTLNCWMMMERYPNLKEEVGGLILSCEISSLLDGKICKVVNCLLCFGVGMWTFCLKVNESINDDS